MPADTLTPLADGDCPLLARYRPAELGGLRDRFNALVASVARVVAERKPAALAEPGRLDEVLSPLARARDLLARRRYVVGFVGVSQAGKSTTVNNVLGEEVCKAGAMDATSSLPTRIVKAAARSLDVQYLTADEWSDRRRRLCRALNIDAPEGDRDLLRRLAEPDKLRLPDGTRPPRLEDDVRYLREFLSAAESHRDVLSEKRRERLGLSYERRYDFTTHGGKAGTEAALLREARFHIDNPVLVDELEVCDLPGLDSKRTVDDEVTWEYLPDLHGVFLFVNIANNLLAEGMLKILKQVTDKLGRLAGRGWVIFNKMDAVSRESYRAAGGDNIFTTIDRFLGRVEVPPSQVVFCSNEVWGEYARGRPGNVADRAAVAERLKQTAAAPTPAVCPAALRPAWDELLKDGGISHVRRLMVEQVAGQLSAQICDDAARRLNEADDQFRAAVAAAERQAAMSTADVLAVNTCQNTVQRTRQDLTRRPNTFPVFAQEAERVRQELLKVLDRQAAELFDDSAPSERKGHFEHHTDVLDQLLAGELEGPLLERAFQAVSERLNGLPSVELGPDRLNCLDAWRRYALADRGDLGWLADRPRFSVRGFEARLTDADDPLNGGQYVQLLTDKIDAAVRQFAHLVRRRVRHRLGALAAELARLTGRRDTP